MKRIFTLVVLLLIAGSALLARRVPEERALGYARNWWLQKDGPRSVVLEPVATEFQNIYLFVDTAGRGFVMLSADDRSIPVLGYSLSNDFAVDGMPEHVHAWLQDYDDQIQWLIDNNIEKTAEINEQWRDLNNAQSQLPAAWSESVPAMVQTTWNQGVPYNNMCPTVSGNMTYTGCVATAMAQIMKYWNHPTSGIGSKQYTWKSQTLSANFANTTYDWTNMLSVYGKYSNGKKNYDSTEMAAVATLMYHVGVAVEMGYGTSASSASTVATSYDAVAAVNAYKKYFKYKWTATSVYIGDYSDDGWKLLLKAEIDAGRPIQYSGRGGGGHSFVCDGYGTNEEFHFNWGWGGSYDGMFAIGALNPGGGGTGSSSSHTYNLQNKAVIGIEPDNGNTGENLSFYGAANNSSYGSVSGGGSTYRRFQDIVTLTPTANIGYRFVNWSNGSSEVPLKFLASGQSTTLTANFEPVAGDTMYYCKDGCATSYCWGEEYSMQYWGIKLPSSVLTAGRVLTDVMLYVSATGTYIVRIYEDDFNTAAVHSDTFSIAESGKWVTLKLSAIRNVNVTKDLCIGVESNASYPCSVSSCAATQNTSWGHSAGNTNWSKRTLSGYDFPFMIKAVTAPPHSITMDAAKAHITSATKNVDLRNINGLCVPNKESTVTYQFVSCSPAGIATVVNNEITATGVGTVTVKAISTPVDTRFPAADATVTLTINKGTLVFDNNAHDGSWANVANWAPHYTKLPDPTNFNAQVNAPCNVASSVQCGDLSIGDDGIINVASNGVLNVEGELTNSDPSKLLIKADTTGSGSVVFANGQPKATVEMYLKGTIGANGMYPDWQLRGSIVGSDFALKNDNNEWANVHVYEWDESRNARTDSGCWKNLMVGNKIKLAPWKGYGFANYSTTPITVAYTGTLINQNKTWTLTLTGSDNANVGVNMLTNSYAAPLEISRLNFSNSKSSVIMYNTGSLADWQTYDGSLINLGYSPGQFMVSPKVTAKDANMPTVIPSGQSFYVIAEQDNASLSANYGNVVSQAGGPMYMPTEHEQLNVLGITIKSEKGADRAVLIECDDCTDGYDDGYDGMKFFGNAALPQLYVVNSFGGTSINADNTILNQKLGVSSPEVGVTMEISFETAKLNGFAQLMLHDLRTGAFANVLADDKYSFVTTSNDTARFEIVGFRMQNDGENDEQLRVCGNRLFVGQNSGRMIMYDMSGKIVWQADVQPDDWIELPELLHGVYVIKTDGSTTKIIK